MSVLLHSIWSRNNHNTGWFRTLRSDEVRKHPDNLTCTPASPARFPGTQANSSWAVFFQGHYFMCISPDSCPRVHALPWTCTSAHPRHPHDQFLPGIVAAVLRSRWEPSSKLCSMFQKGNHHAQAYFAGKRDITPALSGCDYNMEWFKNQ